MPRLQRRQPARRSIALADVAIGTQLGFITGYFPRQPEYRDSSECRELWDAIREEFLEAHQPRAGETFWAVLAFDQPEESAGIVPAADPVPIPKKRNEA